MSGAFNARRYRRRPSINITSLIDVMFLLLIFFMVSSTFRQQFSIDVNLPEAASAEERQPGRHQLVVTAEGQYYLDETRLEQDALREALRALVEDDPDAQLTVLADEAVAFGRVVHAVDLARQEGGKRLSILTRYGDSEAP